MKGIKSINTTKNPTIKRARETAKNGRKTILIIIAFVLSFIVSFDLAYPDFKPGRMRPLFRNIGPNNLAVVFKSQSLERIQGYL